MHADSDADSEIGIWIGIERLGSPSLSLCDVYSSVCQTCKIEN